MNRLADGLPWQIPHEAMRFAGYRALRELASTRPQDPVGYGALGMYLFSHAAWLAQEMRAGGFDRIVFLARDGYWVKRAYDLVAPAMGVDVPSAYARISRQAAFPLHFPEAEALSALPDWVDVTAHTPMTLAALLEPVLRGDVQAAVEACGLAWTQRLTRDDIFAFAAACRSCWDQAAADAYRAHARAYLAPLFTGRCATFDVGYNLRSEAVIREVVGADITAFITHTDSDVPHRRGVPFRTLYPASPFVSWVAREQFLLEDAPLCVGYGADGPVLATQAADVHPEIRRCQEAAMAFVEDLVRTVGRRLVDMPLRPADGCAAFEQFLHSGPYRLMKPFRLSRVENAFHAGAAGEDGTFLQWRLMQTDYRAAVLGEPRMLNRLRRALIRVREEPRGALRKLRRG